MKIMMIVSLFVSCTFLNKNNDLINHYQVSSEILESVVNSTIDACKKKMKCDQIEYLYVEIDTTLNWSIQVKTIRRPLDKQFSIFQKELASNVASFYIGKTMCFVKKDVLSLSRLFESVVQVQPVQLSGLAFTYHCLDIPYKEKVYNTLIAFDYALDLADHVTLRNQSIFIDAGDVDISEALEKRGID
ncbi:MAG: hypothetical protein AAFV95_27310 [Bacteroidota bacterium]